MVRTSSFLPLLVVVALFVSTCGTKTPKPETAPEASPTVEEPEIGATGGADAGAPAERHVASRAKAHAEALGAVGGAAVAGREFATAAPGRAAEVKAGAHDDNEEYPMWLEFAGRYDEQRAGLPMALPSDYRDRVILRVVDRAGKLVMNAPFRVEDARGRTLWAGRTYPNGESVVFPRAFFLDGAQDATRVAVGAGQDEVRAEWKPALDGILTVSLSEERTVPEQVPVDVAFVLDATGSMGDEIQQLRDVLLSIHRRLQNASPQADLRFGMVVYRDRGDVVPLEVIPFTADLDSFEVALSQVRAQGGGDTPEDVQSGLLAALDSLGWRQTGLRNAFVIGDAPPHTDYSQNLDYLWAARTANKRAIRFHIIGASGLSLDGEYIFRQIAVATYGQFIFLTYGETGESEGRATASDPGKVSHHTGSNWASRRLDDIVVDLVRRDLAYQVSVPLLASDTPAPSDQQEYLGIRLENLWDQMNRQFAVYSTDTLTAVLLPFENSLEDSSALAVYLRDLSMEVIVKSGAVKLVERDRLDEVLREQELSAGGIVNPAQAVEIGNLLNSRLVLTGKVYRLGTDRVVHVRAIDSETAQIVAAARVRV